MKRDDLRKFVQTHLALKGYCADEFWWSGCRLHVVHHIGLGERSKTSVSLPARTSKRTLLEVLNSFPAIRTPVIEHTPISTSAQIDLEDAVAAIRQRAA